MVRLADMPESIAAHLLKLPLPEFDPTPCVGGPPLAERRVTLISTAGLSRRDDTRFTIRDADYRILPGNLDGADLVMSHVSVNYDRTGFQEDVNVAFPIDRLREFADAGTIGTVADYHYSFMGAIDPAQMEPFAAELAGHLAGDQVDAAILIPV